MTWFLFLIFFQFILSTSNNNMCHIHVIDKITMNKTYIHVTLPGPVIELPECDPLNENDMTIFIISDEVYIDYNKINSTSQFIQMFMDYQRSLINNPKSDFSVPCSVIQKFDRSSYQWSNDDDITLRMFYTMLSYSCMFYTNPVFSYPLGAMFNLTIKLGTYARDYAYKYYPFDPYSNNTIEIKNVRIVSLVDYFSQFISHRHVDGTLFEKISNAKKAFEPLLMLRTQSFLQHHTIKKFTGHFKTQDPYILIVNPFDWIRWALVNVKSFLKIDCNPSLCCPGGLYLMIPTSDCTQTLFKKLPLAPWENWVLFNTTLQDIANLNCVASGYGTITNILSAIGIGLIRTILLVCSSLWTAIKTGEFVFIDITNLVNIPLVICFLFNIGVLGQLLLVMYVILYIVVLGIVWIIVWIFVYRPLYK